MGIVTQEVKALVNAKVAECVEKAEAAYGLRFRTPIVRYGVKGGTAGRAKLREWIIDLNPILLMENIDEMVNDTVVHEFAHLVDYKLHPENFERRLERGRNGRMRWSKRDVHGATWKGIMRTLGVTPTRTHNMDTSSVTRRRQFKWVGSDGSVMMLGPKRHAKQMAAVKAGKKTHYYMRGSSHASYTYVPENGVETVSAVRSNSVDAQEQLRKLMDQQAAALAAQDKASVAPAPSSTDTRSNKDKAREAFRQAGGSRQAFISLCESKGIKKTTAGTYWHNFSSGKWS
jgi:SprT protein